MRLKILSFLLFGAALCFFSCEDPISKTPYLTLKNISKSYMSQNGQDSVFLTIGFEDGDGDIISDTADNIFIYDSRTGTTIATYKIPDYLPANPDKLSRKGELTLVLLSQCCIYLNGTSCQSSTTNPEQTMFYEVQLKDLAGNYSNRLTTPEITLACD